MKQILLFESLQRNNMGSNKRGKDNVKANICQSANIKTAVVANEESAQFKALSCLRWIQKLLCKLLTLKYFIEGL